MEDLLFNYVTPQKLRQLIKNRWEVVKIETYREMDYEDSIYVILRKI